MTNNKKQRTMNYSKQTQTNPNEPKFTRRSIPVRHSPLATAEAKAGKAKFWAF